MSTQGDLDCPLEETRCCSSSLLLSELTSPSSSSLLPLSSSSSSFELEAPLLSFSSFCSRALPG